ALRPVAKMKMSRKGARLLKLSLWAFGARKILLPEQRFQGLKQEGVGDCLANAVVRERPAELQVMGKRARGIETVGMPDGTRIEHRRHGGGDDHRPFWQPRP